MTTLSDDSGQTRENSARKIAGQVTHLLSLDTILMESAISSLQVIEDFGEKRILVGLSDQSILLYSEAGAPLWKYVGKNSIFTKPFVKEGFAWIDQGNEVIGISIKTGKKERKFSTPGGAGTPFVLNHTLFSASSKRLLYGFSL